MAGTVLAADAYCTSWPTVGAIFVSIDLELSNIHAWASLTGNVAVAKKLR